MEREEERKEGLTQKHAFECGRLLQKRPQVV